MKQVLPQRQNETEYKHTFIHEHKSEQKLVKCEMNREKKGTPEIMRLVKINESDRGEY